MWRSTTQTRATLQRPKWVTADLALALVFGAEAGVARASSAQGACINNLRQIAVGIQDYRETMGTWPTDIRDAAGRPLLSWRVQLLPFIENAPLYRQFHLDEPWDSPHNRLLIKQVPRVYLHPSGNEVVGLTCYVAPRGAETVLAPLPAGAVRKIRKDAAATVLVVEVDDDHSVIWTRPADLAFDSAKPFTGLGRRHWYGFGHGRGCFAAFADGSVHFLPATIDKDLLCSLISAADGPAPELALPWNRALLVQPLIWVMVPWLVFSVCAIAGGIPVAYRLVRRRTVSPGELLG